MTTHDFAQFVLMITLLGWLTPVLGNYLYRVYEKKKLWMDYALSGIEHFTYKITNVDATEEMTWTEYAKNMLVFNLIGLIFLFLLQIFQSALPLNPQQLPGVSWDLSFNTAISFVTNTNWQAYSGETTMSYLTQMLGLSVQNFLSAATGMGALLVLMRGIARKSSLTIGNFWVDIVRTVLYVLIPLCLLLVPILIYGGSIQNFSKYQEIETVEGVKQTIPMGPVASQVAIKQIGTNGGGFFNANSAHPFENPTPLSNFFETLAILLIPAATTFMFGSMIGSRKHGWILFIVMLFLLLAGLCIALYFENQVNPIFGDGSNWEGKETRFGVAKSILWGVSTTATSNGSVNSMISSYSPLAGAVALFNILIGEIIFGGVGVGLCSMLMFVFLTVFLSGLMVGRTPEYQGKKIEKREMLWVMLAILTSSAVILCGTGFASVLPVALSSLSNQGPHGLSELLYAFASAGGNNGSAFAGLNANTPFFNLALGSIMLVTRLAILIPSLAIGGLLVRKKVTPPSIGTFSTDTFLFAILIIGVVIIVGALTFFPVLTLGPVVEHFLMLKGETF